MGCRVSGLGFGRFECRNPQDVAKIPDFCKQGAQSCLAELQNLEKVCKALLAGRGGEQFTTSLNDAAELATGVS